MVDIYQSGRNPLTDTISCGILKIEADERENVAAKRLKRFTNKCIDKLECLCYNIGKRTFVPNEGVEMP